MAKEGLAEDELSHAVIGAAIEVHRAFGPGLLESVYQRALCQELADKGLAFVCQMNVPIRYKGRSLGSALLADVVVEDRLLIELKSVDCIDRIHYRQVVTYLRLLGLDRGLLINFNVSILKEGIKRVLI